MRFLILSDIHANSKALDAVVRQAAGSYEKVLCLGDVVGYGAEPNATVAWVREHAALTVRGNHDRACCGDRVIEDFSDSAYVAGQWTRSELTAENREWLEQLPQGPLAMEGFYLCHGSPIDEDEYVINTYDAGFQYRYLPGDVCFFGHTHLQGAFAMRPGKVWFHAPDRDLALEPGTSYLINPGAVGQPRDHDKRAAYAIYDTESRVVRFERTVYDIAGAQQAIREAGLPEYLAARLALGR